MKHFRILLPLLILALMLSRSGSRQDVKVYNKTLAVDTKNCAISDGTYSYRYTVSGSTITITYPDGSRFWQEEGGYGWSEDYDASAESIYSGGMTLTGDAAKAEIRKLTIGKAFSLLIPSAIGYWLIFLPEKAWYHFGKNTIFKKNQIPSESEILIVRAWGILLTLVSIAAFIT